MKSYTPLLVVSAMLLQKCSRTPVMASPSIYGQSGISEMIMHMFCFLKLIRIISYVMLCGYPPFRSEDEKELTRLTVEARIEFHEKYWKNVSEEGIDYLMHFKTSLVNYRSSQILHQASTRPRSSQPAYC